jgi:hypothetical protein
MSYPRRATRTVRPCVVLLAGGDRGEIVVEALAVDMADENFREG